MKRLVLVLVLAVSSVSTIGCKCSAAAKQAAIEIQETNNLVFPEYVAYVGRDTALDADAKARRLRTVESLERLVNRLRAALEE